MMYIDPFNAQCEHCSAVSAYPLETLLAYSALCSSCGQLLIQAAKNLNKGYRDHRIAMWPTHCIFEAIDIYKVDLNRVSELAIESILTVDDLVQFLTQQSPEQTRIELSEIPMLKGVVDHLVNEKLTSYRLAELAEITELVTSNEAIKTKPKR